MKNSAAKPPAYNAAIVRAVQDREQGQAVEHQQKILLEWIITQASDAYGLSYRPGDTHDTAFAEGRRFVGLEIVKMLKLEASKIK